MLGFAWVTLRQAQDALSQGRLEEAKRLLMLPAAQGHKKAGELLVRVASAFVERGERFLRMKDPTPAWNDLLAAEQVGNRDSGVLRLRQSLADLGIAEIRALLEAGEPGRAQDAITALRARQVSQPELHPLEEASRAWVLAREQGARGDFSIARQTMERARALVGMRIEAMEKTIAQYRENQSGYADLQVKLHEAVARKEWPEVLRLSEQVLEMAPQHLEARKARARAWRVIEPQTVSVSPTAGTQPPASDSATRPTASPRFLLWIDGVGGYLVCLGNKITIGQATGESAVDIPLFADVSRLHATLVRESEGYIVEANRAVKVNGRAAERSPLQSGDRLTLGGSCQLVFQQPVPVSASARIEVTSGHRLPLTVDGIVLMADTLVLGPGPQAHIVMPDLAKPVVLFRQKDGLGIRYAGELTVDGQRVRDRGSVGLTGSVSGDDFAFALEPVGTGTGRL